MKRYTYDLSGRLVVKHSDGSDNKIYEDAIDLIKELEANIAALEASAEALSERFNSQAESFQQARAKIVHLEAAVREKDNQRIQFSSIIDSIDMIMSCGEEPPDFMMSFPLVRAVWDQCERIAALTAELKMKTVDWMEKEEGK